MPPSNAGGYSDRLGPKTPFFQSGGFDSDYGKAFLEGFAKASRNRKKDKNQKKNERKQKNKGTKTKNENEQKQ